jgi:hypothetical protein
VGVGWQQGSDERPQVVGNELVNEAGYDTVLIALDWLPSGSARTAADRGMGGAALRPFGHASTP